MAFFLRTRRLDLKRLERKPQENIDVVHVILKASIHDVTDKLRRLERQFYGPGKTALDEVLKWNVMMKSVMATVHMGQITNSWQLEEIIKRSDDPTAHFKVDLVDLNKLKECYRKTRDTVPSKFSDIILDCRSILKYLEKYCLSFYNTEDDVPFETAQHYELKRQELIKTIRTNIDAINTTAEKFRASERGLQASALTQYGIDMARKVDCVNTAFLVLFQTCCDNIRVSLDAMTSWIDTDASYPVFIKNDVTDLEKKKTESLKEVRDLQQKFHQLSFRQKQQEAEATKMESDIEKIGEKEGDMMIQEEELLAETNDLQVEIENKEYRRDDLMKRAADLHPQILYDRYSELSESLRDLKRRLPFAKRELFAMKHKLEWMSGKRVELRLLKKKLSQIRREMEEIDQQKLEREVEHDALLNCLELTRRILLYKSCPDAMEKIFNERPVEVNKARLPGQRARDDPFERACKVAAQHIEGDWPKFYRALPFHPPRGVKTIDRDIQELSSVESRVGLDKLTLKCLFRWRRFHTRAKMEDINVALADIKRYDVITKIDLDLNPRDENAQEPEEPITYVEEYLIPFVRQVEKFDKLRAQNRL